MFSCVYEGLFCLYASCTTFMENETKYRLSYCQICKNRARNYDFTVICGLTNEIPKFKNNCEKYYFDELTYNRKVEEIKDEIKEKYNKDTLYKKYFGNLSYTEYNFINDSKYKNVNQTKELKILKHKLIYVVILTISLFALFTLPIMYKLKVENQQEMIIIYITLSLMSFYSIFALIFKEKKVFLETNDKSIIIENEEIFWNSIISTGVLTVSDETSQDFVILGTLDDGIVKLNCYDFIYAKDIIKIIHLNVNVIQRRFGAIGVLGKL